MATKGFDKMSDLPTRPLRMLDNARAYSKASYTLNQKAFGPSFQVEDMDLGLPSAVNAALAIELYLKTLYLLEKGEDFKFKGRHSHDFHLLFGQLNMTTKRTMEVAFADSISRREMTDVQRMEKVGSILIPRDLLGNLFIWKDVFVGIRYIHERKGNEVPMFFFPEIENAILVPIFQLNPGLEHLTSFTWRKVT